MKAATALSMLGLMALAGCAQPVSSPQSRANAAQVAACRRSADQAVLIQDPGVVYQSDAYVSGTQSTPFSGGGFSSSSLTGGLPQRYKREQYYDNCLNGIGPAPAAFPPEPPSGPAASGPPMTPAPVQGVTSAPLRPRSPSPDATAAPSGNLSAPPANLTSPPPP